MTYNSSMPLFFHLSHSKFFLSEKYCNPKCIKYRISITDTHTQ